MAEVSDWLKTVRFATAFDKMNQAGGQFAAAGYDPQVQEIAKQISNLYEGMRFGSEDIANDYDARTAAAREAMLKQFAAADANTNAAYQNSQNYQSEIAKRLGLEGTLQSPGVETRNQQQNQLLAMNAANRTNQLASYDLLRGGYGELLRDRIGSFDVQRGTTLANLLTQLQAQQAAAAAAAGSGGGGGGRGRGRSSSKPTTPVPSDATYNTVFQAPRPIANRAGAMLAKEGGIDSGRRPSATKLSLAKSGKTGGIAPKNLMPKKG